MRYLFILCLIFPLQTFASQVAKVILLKGQVSEINSDGIKKNLNKGDWVNEGSELLTQSKSFAKLLFVDKSSVNIGPSSNMKITAYKKNEPGIISLLKGQIRSKVEKDLLQNKEEDKSKLFIKTKNAAMGVRGTDFIVGFDPVIGNTKLDVITGVVAMVNIQEIGSFVTPQALDRALNGSLSVRVEKGMRTSVSDTKAPPEPPQEIPKAELDNFKQKVEEFFLPSDDSPEKEEVKEEIKQEEAQKEEEPKEGEFRDPIPPDVPKESFLNDSPDFIEVTELERLPTSEVEIEETKVETEIEPPPTEEVIVDTEELDEIVEDTVDQIEETITEDVEEITDIIQNPDNFTRVRIRFSDGDAP